MNNRYHTKPQTGSADFLADALGIGPRVLFTTLRYSLGVWLHWRFRIRITYDHRSAVLRPPFVVLANHVNFWDPFLVAIPFGPPVHFIAADGNFRGRIMRRLMAFAGTVPKAKARNDLESIRALQALIDEGKIIGIFPEGQRSWDGRSRPVLPGTPKLVRLLKAPVVSVRLRGGYLSTPRWTKSLRRGELHLDVQTILTAKEIAELPKTTVVSRIATAVTHDETEWQRKTGILFSNRRRAEYAETALFWCPECDHWGTLRSQQNELKCTHCGSATWFAPSGTLYRVGHDGAKRHHRFGNLADWNEWQCKRLQEAIDPIRPLPGTRDKDREPMGTEVEARPTYAPLPYSIPETEFLTGYRSRVLYPRGIAALHISPSELSLTTKSRTWRLPIARISAIHVQYAHQLEFYVERTLFVVRMLRPQDSAYRIEETILALQRPRSN